jgi:FtsZ-interacting cell division protein ZipA
MGGFVIPLWLKIVGPIAMFALVVGGVMAWGNSRYRAGKADGIEETDAKWEEASAKLKADAAKSATKADDAAVKRLEEHVAQANEDAAAVEKAKAEGRSPIDALFGN